MKLLGISGTILGIKTYVLVQRILDEVKQKHPEIEVEMLDLRDYDLQFCDGRKLDDYNEDTRKVIEKVTQADFYLIGSPIFNSSIPAPLKNLIDLIPPDVFRHKVMGFAANGGTNQHYLMVENQLKPIAGYLRAYIAPSYVYAHTSHYNDKNEIHDEEIVMRIRNLADELVHMQHGLGQMLIRE
ncbi:NADPH-dependent FMN reductase [Peribacillus sp. TH14]|uniref:NADPH-dependent FMN reductase n=1 Tax=Peribacillus sp. TH14 TaxID=2798481 RepID=UPI0019126C54|nr:NAD(P)H-dependent oxidoreductase [Peribacillus sp. TH14]MBK5502209.1 NAD(P)H-dependent oxidoreductase [Peribacillus sp. TH14]